MKLPTAKIDFIDFLQIEAVFQKTNYITFSYLPIATDGKNISGKKFRLWPRNFRFAWFLPALAHKASIEQNRQIALLKEVLFTLLTRGELF